MKIIEIIFILFIGFVMDHGYFEFIHMYYCRKNNGNCKTCKDWSCPRQKYLNKEGDLK